MIFAFGFLSLVVGFFGAVMFKTRYEYVPADRVSNAAAVVGFAMLVMMAGGAIAMTVSVLIFLARFLP